MNAVVQTDGRGARGCAHEAGPARSQIQSVHDLDDQIDCLDEAGLPRGIAARSWQVLETDEAMAILCAALPSLHPTEGRLYITGCHQEEGLVAFGAQGRNLHIVHLVNSN